MNKQINIFIDGQIKRMYKLMNKKIYEQINKYIH